jgi:outer membrane protein
MYSLRNIIKYSVIAVALNIMCFNIASSAETQSGNYMAIVDSQAILEKSTAMLKMREQLDKKAEEFKKESSKKEEYFKNKFGELEKQKSVLAKEAFDQKSDALSQEFNDEQKKIIEKRGVLDKAYNEALQQLDKVFTEVVQDQAKKAGVKVVLHKVQTIYSEESLDITSKVLEALNKKLTSLNVKLD